MRSMSTRSDALGDHAVYQLSRDAWAQHTNASSSGPDAGRSRGEALTGRKPLGQVSSRTDSEEPGRNETPRSSAHLGRAGERTAQPTENKPHDDDPDAGGTRAEEVFEGSHAGASSGSSATARRSAWSKLIGSMSNRAIPERSVTTSARRALRSAVWLRRRRRV